MSDFRQDETFTAWARAHFLDPDHWERPFNESEWDDVLALAALPIGDIMTMSFNDSTDDDAVVAAYNSIVDCWTGWCAAEGRKLTNV